MEAGRPMLVRLRAHRPSASLAVLLVASCALAVFAEPARAGWQGFGIGDGLVDDRVWAIAEDSAENLWFGTSEGLSCYNGVSWRTYSTNDGLAGSTVRAIIEDSSGDLWFGTAGGGGVSCYDGVTWTTYDTDDGLAHVNTQAIVEDRSGDLWFATAAGVSRYDGADWTTYTTADGLADDNVLAIVEDSTGGLWFGTWDGGVSHYDGSSWTTYTTADGLADNHVSAIVEDSSGNLWFGTWSGGVSRYDSSSWTTYTTEDGLVDNNVTSILEDRRGNLWFAAHSPGGLSRFDGENWTTYTGANGPLGHWVEAIIEDSSGNLWFGAVGGLTRYDGVTWTTYTTDDGLAHPSVCALLQDNAGDMWFGTYGALSRYDGVSWTTYPQSSDTRAIYEDSGGDLWFGTDGLGVHRYDGIDWTTYTMDDGLVSNVVRAIIEDSSGDMWFGTLWGGASRYDGESWTTYAPGSAVGGITSFCEDSSGDLWVGVNGDEEPGGLSRYDGSTWTTYTAADGLAGGDVLEVTEDSSGDLWIGTDGGVTVYDGESWTSYTTADGLAHNSVQAISEDGFGCMWFGTYGGLTRCDGVNWTTYTIADGLAGNCVCRIVEDRTGELWMAFSGFGSGVTVHGPDWVAPQTVISPRPPSISSSRTQTVSFAAAFGEVEGVQFSCSFDGTEWSAWTLTDFWTGSGLADGEHAFAVRARDEVGNVDPTPASFDFEVDATAPVPIITSPLFNQAVRGSVQIEGTACDSRFGGYSVEVRPLDSLSWVSLVVSDSPVADGVLGEWNTESVPDGDYELKLSEADTLGLTGTAVTAVVVDNEAPWAWETTPVLMEAASGGDIYTTNREAHLYFPPRALARDALVTVRPADASSVPDSLPGGADLIFAGYEIGWDGVELRKPVTLEMQVEEGSREAEVLAVYVLVEGQDWQRLGGTFDEGSASLTAPINEEGTYAVFSDSGGSGPGTGLSALSFTPRVFSPSGSFANREVAISFSLGRAGPVTVRIYNRAGRLVDEVATGLRMNAGANVVRWDGRDRDGSEVPDGLYIVTVEALGEEQTRSLGVVR